MANILIRHADVLTLDDASVLRNADVAITGGVIVEVGPEGTALPPDFTADEVFDASGRLLMPGFCNAHTHSGTVLRRGLAQGDDIYTAPNGDAAYWAAQLAMAEMIRCGTVAFADQYFYMDRVAEAVAASGLRAVLSWCTFPGPAPSGPGHDAVDGVIGGDLAGVARFAEQWNGAAGGRIHTALGPHSVHRCSPMFLARTAAVAARLGVGIHIHVAVSGPETDAVLAEHEMTPVEVLDKNGVFDVPVTAVHAIHLTHVDIDLLAERGACVAYCPSAHTLQGLGETPVDLLRAAGVEVGIGTDGADAALTLNMFRAVHDATLLCGPRAGEPHHEEAVLQALRMATRDGAKVLGFPLGGRIATGCNADLILIDTRRAHLAPVCDPLLALAHAVAPGDVSEVMVGGDWLMRSGELTTIDMERALHELNRQQQHPF